MAKKKKAVVLGVGAEKGLGAAASRRFAKEGYHVLVAGRTAAKVEKVAESIRAANGSATPVTVDGTKEAEVTRCGTRPWPTMPTARRPTLRCSTWATTPPSTSAR